MDPMKLMNQRGESELNYTGPLHIQCGLPNYTCKIHHVLTAVET
jgi:hypothetical protein